MSEIDWKPIRTLAGGPHAVIPNTIQALVHAGPEFSAPLRLLHGCQGAGHRIDQWSIHCLGFRGCIGKFVLARPPQIRTASIKEATVDGVWAAWKR